MMDARQKTRHAKDCYQCQTSEQEMFSPGSFRQNGSANTLTLELQPLNCEKVNSALILHHWCFVMTAIGSCYSHYLHSVISVPESPRRKPYFIDRKLIPMILMVFQGLLENYLGQGSQAKSRISKTTPRLLTSGAEGSVLVVGHTCCGCAKNVGSHTGLCIDQFLSIVSIDCMGVELCGES